jgi:hypothetical protein
MAKFQQRLAAHAKAMEAGARLDRCEPDHLPVEAADGVEIAHRERDRADPYGSARRRDAGGRGAGRGEAADKAARQKGSGRSHERAPREHEGKAFC